MKKKNAYTRTWKRFVHLQQPSLQSKQHNQKIIKKGNVRHDYTEARNESNEGDKSLSFRCYVPLSKAPARTPWPQDEQQMQTGLDSM